MKKFPVILFFIAAATPSPKEFAEAMTYGPNVRYRNAQYIKESDALEICDGVAGQVPEKYAEAFPTAKEACEKYADEMRAEIEGKHAAAKQAEEVSKQTTTPPVADQKAATKPEAKPAPAPAKPAATEWKANG